MLISSALQPELEKLHHVVGSQSGPRAAKNSCKFLQHVFTKSEGEQKKRYFPRTTTVTRFLNSDASLILRCQCCSKQRVDDRRAQIGTGDRSERIRTYNVMQNRITDHRISFTTHGVDNMLAGGPIFWEITEKLKEEDTRAKLEALAHDP